MKKIQEFGRLVQKKNSSDTAYGFIYSIYEPETSIVKYVFVVQDRYGKIFDIFERDMSIYPSINMEEIKSLQSDIEAMKQFYDVIETKSLQTPLPYFGELLTEQERKDMGLEADNSEKRASSLKVRTSNIPQDEFLSGNVQKGMEHCQIFYSKDRALVRILLFNHPEHIRTQLLVERLGNDVEYIVAEMKPEGEAHVVLAGKLPNKDSVITLVSQVIEMYAPKHTITTYGKGDSFQHPDILENGFSKSLPHVWNVQTSS